MPFPDLLLAIRTYLDTFTTNLSTTVSSLTLRDYIRLVWIIGGYLFMRPYLDAAFRKLLTSNMDKADKEKQEREREEALALAGGKKGAADVTGAGAGKAKLSANALRGVLRELGEDDGVGGGADDEGDEDEEGEGQGQGQGTAVGGGPQWGKSARRRQKRALKELEEAAERMRGEEDDRDIEDLLED
ncbi:hypothetical protein AJ79_00475 [Helicocarpus griseus UAMH5409]|uniref:Protein trafficking Pga2 n=1 Tax=Helicocarpus griseus UAMH5409 TaxID=1447875 RepID=A0A2B7YA61_9EURO|nr:hypothetical protein AJ79_00475 [Helicocarpus griseus UAMH5409]